MKQKAFTLVEIMIVFALIMIVSALVIPLVLNDSKTVQDVSKWRHCYDDVLYTFQSMDINNNPDYKQTINTKILKAKNTDEVEDIILEEFRPYLRIEDRFENKKYSPRYLNSEKVKDGQYYHFVKLYRTQNGQIVGIKWLKELYDNSSLIALMIDTNGEEAPNVWGKDIFGLNIYKTKIEPFGKEMSSSEVDADCSKKGRGVYCSYKYLIGAQF